MFEVELVYRISDEENFRKNISEYLSSEPKEEKQVAIFFIKESSPVIRLRINKFPKAQVSLKTGKFGEARREVEFDVGNYEDFVSFLELTNYELETIFYRKRVKYSLKNGLSASLDYNENGLLLLELEKMVDSYDEKEVTEKEISKFASEFLYLTDQFTKDDFKKSLAMQKQIKPELDNRKIKEFLS